jgi:hypothetical protein
MYNEQMLDGNIALVELRKIKSLREEPRTREMKKFGAGEFARLLEEGLMVSFRKSLKRNDLRDELASFFMMFNLGDRIFLAEIVDEGINVFSVKNNVDDRQVRHQLINELSKSRHAVMSDVEAAIKFLSGNRHAFKEAA